MIFVFLWLTSLSMTVSGSIHVAANGIISFFLWPSNIPLYVYIYIFITSSLFIYLSMGTGCFHVLTVGNSAAMSSGVQVSFQISFCLFHICPGVGLLDHITQFLNFKGNLHTVFHSGCMDLLSQRPCWKILFSPPPPQQLLFVGF